MSPIDVCAIFYLLSSIFSDRHEGVSKHWQILDDCLLDNSPLSVPVTMRHLNTKPGDVSPWDCGISGPEGLAQSCCSLPDNLHLTHYSRAIDVVMLVLDCPTFRHVNLPALTDGEVHLLPRASWSAAPQRGFTVGGESRLPSRSGLFRHAFHFSPLCRSLHSLVPPLKKTSTLWSSERGPHSLVQVVTSVLHRDKLTLADRDYSSRESTISFYLTV